jgi:hypothetical protein
MPDSVPGTMPDPLDSMRVSGLALFWPLRQAELSPSSSWMANDDRWCWLYIWLKWG